MKLLFSSTFLTHNDNPMKLLLVFNFIVIIQTFAFCQSGDVYRSLPLLDEDEEIFRRFDRAAVFPGCDVVSMTRVEKEMCTQKELMNYIYSNLRYPEEARKKKVSGQVVIEFVIAYDGTIRNVELLRGFDRACDNAVIKVIEDMNDLDDLWTPAVLDNEYVSTYYTRPISFEVLK